MKKKFAILTLCAISMSFVACNQAQKSEADTQATETTETADTTATVTETPSEILANYEVFVDKYVKAVEGMAKSDTDSYIEYNKLMQNAAEISNKTQKASADFSKEEQDKYGKLIKKYNEMAKAVANSQKN